MAVDDLLLPRTESSALTALDRGLWTAALYAAIMALCRKRGICYAMLGPTLLGGDPLVLLARRLPVAPSAGARRFGGRPGVPFLQNLAVAYTSQALQGLSMGLLPGKQRLDTGGNVLMLTVWRNHKHLNAAVHGNSAALESFHFLFGVGALIAPLCVSWALKLDLDAVQVWLLEDLKLGSPEGLEATAVEDIKVEAKPLPRVVLFTGAFLLSYVGLEVAFGGYVDPFAVKQLDFSKDPPKRLMCHAEVDSRSVALSPRAPEPLAVASNPAARFIPKMDSEILSGELQRIKDLQKSSVDRMQILQSQQAVLQKTFDSLLQRLEPGEVMRATKPKAKEAETPEKPQEGLREPQAHRPNSSAGCRLPSVTQASITVEEEEAKSVTFEEEEAPEVEETNGKEEEDTNFRALRGTTIVERNLHRDVLEHVEDDDESPHAEALKKVNPSSVASVGLAGQVARKVVKHWSFEVVVGIVIWANLVVQGFELEHSLLPQPKDPWPASVEVCFLIFYIAELVLRLAARGLKANLMDPWFVLDLLVVIGSIATLILYSADGFNGILFVRGVRLLRLGRSLQSIKRIRIVWYLLRGLLQSGQVLIATFSLLVLALYIAACIGVEVISKDTTLASNAAVASIVSSSFGSLRLTMLTLIQFVTMDSIAEIYIPLVQAKPELVFYFLALLLILPITLLNLVTAVLVENGLSQAQKDAEYESQARSQEMRQAVLRLIELFQKLDNNSDGGLSRAELASLPDAHIPKGLLESLAADDLVELFDLLDVDRTGELSQEEFVDGLLQMVVRDVPMETMRMMKILQSVHKSIRSLTESYAKMLSTEMSVTVL
ncbi:unnamed protein product [Effrenium voratum]|uniref:EF-hand domain-containing protein n=1 Tax=Effrenium voratum TaxID=2562239 RepID=A0AA36HTY1_9DINO|nr:unnamed protein product [Effrenium voratum]